MFAIFLVLAKITRLRFNHFDETIKCMLAGRSFLCGTFPYGVEAIKRCAHVILPREADYMEDATSDISGAFGFRRYLSCAPRSSSPSTTQPFSSPRRNGTERLFDNFMAESNYP